MKVDRQRWIKQDGTNANEVKKKKNCANKTLVEFA